MAPISRIRSSSISLALVTLLVSSSLIAQPYQASNDLSGTPISVDLVTEGAVNSIPIESETSGGLDLPAGAPIVIKSETFEGTFPNVWVVSDNNGPVTGGDVTWAATTAKANSGSKSGWSAGGGADGVAGGTSYPNDMDSWMRYGPFDLSDAVTATVDFSRWTDLEPGVDFLQVLYTSTCGSYAAGLQWSANTGGWAASQADISAMAGSSGICVLFRVVTNGSVTGDGAYVDDIVISKSTAAPDFDLGLQVIDVADEVYGQGSAISMTTVVENTGAVSSAWAIRYYISTDANITAEDTSLGSVSGLPALAIGETFQASIGSSLPSPLANGTYYIGAIIETVDADASNNTAVDFTGKTVNSAQVIRVRPASITVAGSPAAPLLVEEEPGGAAPYARAATRAKSEVLNELLPLVDEQGQVSIIIGLETPFVPEGLLDESARRAQQASISRVQSSVAASLRGTNFTEKVRFEFIPYMALRVDRAALEALAKNPAVFSIEEDRISKPLMDSSNPVIGSPIAWAGGMDGSGQAVAILDTGVDISHAWFTTGGSRIVAEACYSADNGAVTDPLCPGGVESSTAPGSGVNCVGISGCDHGTHVAGTVAGNDGSGPDYGVARDANIIAMQVFTKFLQSGSCAPESAPCVRSYTSDQLQALARIKVLKDGGMDIASANMSLGGGQFFDEASCDAANPSMLAAIDTLASVGIATVIAAGNDGFTTSTGTPGCISSAINVGATNDRDSVAGFSNIASFVDLLAPGVAIDSSVPGGTGSKQGTSMATPHVAGAWAVLKEYVPAASVAQIETALTTTGTVVDDGRYGGTVTGMRRINVEQALANLGYATHSFGVSNEGFSTLNVTSIAPTVATPWLSFNPTVFSVAPGRMQVVEVVVDFSGAPLGVTNRTIAVASNDGTENVSLSVDNAGLGPAPTADQVDASTVGPTNADSIAFTIGFSEDVTGFNDASDVIVSHSGTANTGVTITGSGSAYTATVTGITGNGSLTLAVNTASDVIDSSGQGLASSVTSSSVVIDNLPPGISIGSPSAAITSTAPVSFPITYIGAGTVTLAPGDVTLIKTGSANGTVGVTGSGASARTVTISGISGSGTLAISIAAGTASDVAGNFAASHAASATFDVDNTSPTVTAITPATTGPTNAGSVSFSISFSEPVSGFTDAGDVVITHSGTSNSGVTITGSDAAYTANVTGIDGTGSFTLKVNTASGVQDLLGNPLVVSIVSAVVNIDNEPPGITISAPSPASTVTGPVTFTLTYTGASSIVADFTGLISVTATGTAAAASVVVTGAGLLERTVTLSGITGSGTLAINVAAGTAEDEAGNTAGAAGPSETVLIAFVEEIFEDSFEDP